MRSFIAIALAAVAAAVVVWFWVGSHPPEAPPTEPPAVYSFPTTPAPSASPSGAPGAPAVAQSGGATASPMAAPAPGGAAPAPLRGATRDTAPPQPVLAGPQRPGSESSAPPPPAPPGIDESQLVATEADAISLMLRDYRTRMGENPVGTNAEIMRAVMGENPKQAKLGPPEGGRLNGQGELIDRWGTPYFFHQLSRNSTEIRSAGPDRRLWTEDDVIAH